MSEPSAPAKNYAVYKQTLNIGFKNVLKSLRIDPAALKGLAGGAFVMLAVLCGAGALIYGLLRRKASERRMVDNFVRKMRKYGYERTMSEGLHELTAKIEDPGLREKSNVFASEFEGLL
jgi:hypothetical protein